jgi:hypothetical protein
MTKNEILNNTTWDDYQMGACSLYVPIFDKEIPFIFFQDHQPEPSITDKMLDCIHDILALEISQIETIKEMLWEECIFAFTVADYGFEPDEGETHVEAHLKGFEISNKEDVFIKSQVMKVHISQENDNFMGRYAEIKIDSAADNLISIIVKNGKIIDWDDDGTYLGWFENDEQYAQRKRKTFD